MIPNKIFIGEHKLLSYQIEVINSMSSFRFTRYSTTRSTRHMNTFVMVQTRTNIKAMCLSVYGVKLWNSLSTNLSDCNSVIIFKKNLKKYFISIY